MQLVNAGIAENACNDPAPGGEPLWHVPQEPHEIHPSADPASNGTKPPKDFGVDRRLPGTTQRLAIG
jgi:hypothetical protein